MGKKIAELAVRYADLFGEAAPLFGYMEGDATKEITRALEQSRRMVGAKRFYKLAKEVRL